MWGSFLVKYDSRRFLVRLSFTHEQSTSLSKINNDRKMEEKGVYSIQRVSYPRKRLKMARKGWREVTNDAKFALLVSGGARFSDPFEKC